MDSNIAQAVQEELTCVICVNALIDPVTIDCGHSFCRPCLCLSWEETQTPARCPVCRVPSQQRDFSTNILLKRLVSIARKASFRQFLSSEEHSFKTNKKIKRMLCRVDKNMLCSPSQKHQTNRHCPMEGAAEEHREKILKEMRSVWERIQEIQRIINEEERIIDEWVSYVTMHRVITSDIYEMLHPNFQEERKQYSEILTNEETVVLQQLKKRETQMLQKKKDLRKLYQELVKTYQKPDVELLQNVKYILARCESMLVFMPKTMKPELSAHPIPGLIDSLSQYGRKFFFGHETQNINMMFDHVQMFGPTCAVSFLNFDGINYFAVSGAQIFCSGKHYWELSVDDSLDWAVGIYKNCKTMNEPVIIDPEDVFLLLCVKDDIGYSIFTTSPMLRHYIEKPLGKIGIFLDLENGSEIDLVSYDSGNLEDLYLILL
ncbi:tripartite motif-containing protein 43-like [Dipodomys spectabilis]|uniref:tripartite motif-containing protein 43-like n=1 Tax=Dipodomys spectabilis TaxID=105255 RepID=UPI001C548F66|nr:tripartite motif-containing protein 43-like [Dipodomys spectabilis]